MDYFFENVLKGDGALGDLQEEAHLVRQKTYIGNPQSLVGKATAVAGHSRHIMALAA